MKSLRFLLFITAVFTGTFTSELYPQSDFIAKWSKSRFDCHFEQPVDCFWTKSGIPKEIWPYGYESRNGYNTTDCSVWALSQVYKKDWECVGIPHTKMSRVIVRSTQKMTLGCQVNGKASCLWARNTIKIPSSNKYSYQLNTLSGGCSITIHDLAYEDYAVWTCHSSSQVDNEAAPNAAYVLLMPYNSEITTTTTAALTSTKSSPTLIPMENKDKTPSLAMSLYSHKQNSYEPIVLKAHSSGYYSTFINEPTDGDSDRPSTEKKSAEFFVEEQEGKEMNHKDLSEVAISFEAENRKIFLLSVLMFMVIAIVILLTLKMITNGDKCKRSGSKDGIRKKMNRVVLIPRNILKTAEHHSDTPYSLL